jgi:hypothetical protein
MEPFDDLQDANEYHLSSVLVDSTYGDELCVHSLALLHQVQVQVYTRNYCIQKNSPNSRLLSS